MKHACRFIFFIFFLLIISKDLKAQSEEKIRVTIDCRGCSENFMRQNLTFFDHVRDQDLAEVYLLVNRNGNPSSEIYVLEFDGKKRFEGIDNKYTVSYSRTLTGNEIRDKLLEAIKSGFVPYLMHTDLAEEIVTELPDTIENKQNVVVNDPWKNWIFEVRGNFDLNDQETRNELRYNIGFEGDKVTENWRVRVDGFYNRNILNIEESDDVTFTSVVDRRFFRGSIVKSLGNHWSTGVFSTIESNTVDNFKIRTTVSPAVEYSLFDYQDVLTREITFSYRVTWNYQEYIEPTIFGVNTDRFPSQQFSVNIRFRKNWGSIFSSVRASNFLDDFSKNRFSTDNWVSIRIFKGFSVRFNGEFEVIRDQINLQQGDASLEDIILQQRAIATGYRLELGVGISYTFGSIYNNILNTRL